MAAWSLLDMGQHQEEPSSHHESLDHSKLTTWNSFLFLPAIPNGCLAYYCLGQWLATPLSQSDCGTIPVPPFPLPATKKMKTK